MRPAFFLNLESLNLKGEGSESDAYRISTGDEDASASILSVADRVSSVSASSSYKAMSGDIAGSIVGTNFADIYSNSSMDLSAVNSANSSNAVTETKGASRTLTQIKRESFLKTVFGPTTYQSLDYLNTDPTAVWVVKNGELPELYYNVLNDIIVSDEIENGTITTDKAQAVDDEIVTVTATPDDGYTLNTIYVNGEEIVGNTFEVNGNANAYATFSPVIPTYTATVSATDNASATLVNADEKVSLFALSDRATTINADDGTEIEVNASASKDYNIDAIVVNGEEIAGDSFIIDKNTNVELVVSSIKTDITATTGGATNIGYTTATLSGSVEKTGDDVSGYITYWKDGEEDVVYTTTPITGGGAYSIEVTDLIPSSTYYYKMCENGEVKSFATLNDEDVDSYEYVEEELKPITTTTIKKLTSTYKFNISSEIELTEENVIVAVYDSTGKLISVTMTTFDGDTEGYVSIPKNTNISYAKVFVWDEKQKPLGGVEMIEQGF